MNRSLSRRLSALESAYDRPVFIMGTIVTSDGEVIGLTTFAPWATESLDAIRQWARDPRPGFVFLWSWPVEQCEGSELIPLDELSAEARRMVEPYTEPGTVLHQT